VFGVFLRDLFEDRFLIVGRSYKAAGASSAAPRSRTGKWLKTVVFGEYILELNTSTLARLEFRAATMGPLPRALAGAGMDIE
jgi:hypothetical protein